MLDESASKTGFEGAGTGEVAQEDLARMEQAITRSFQMSLAMWSVGFEIVRTGVEEWGKRHRDQLKQTMVRLEAAQKLETPEKRAEAFSEIVTSQPEAWSKNLAAAGYKAMAYAGAHLGKLAADVQAATRESQRDADAAMNDMRDIAMRTAGVQPMPEGEPNGGRRRPRARQHG